MRRQVEASASRDGYGIQGGVQHPLMPKPLALDGEADDHQDGDTDVPLGSHRVRPVGSRSTPPALDFRSSRWSAGPVFARAPKPHAPRARSVSGMGGAGAQARTSSARRSVGVSEAIALALAQLVRDRWAAEQRQTLDRRGSLRVLRDEA